MSSSRALTTLLIIYLALAFTTFLVWEKQDRFPVTGDEPHYLGFQ